ncbi:aminotransferase [Candidatus Methylomirabilis limnetica]|uniref:Aminotransferase n=1 Tax=Candidatus Methylomirabilis limnetica TaxID=2033718 RepID=A0A2T4TYG0_9BACT|nr:alanine--glyoxylate aminotransferase family protein [Candidatus Methylomirabilis limnetica]PTL36153.1 aminotransferase [Candidatus Methylomirabilis limnetica]
MKKRHLLAPGPTQVLPEALLAMARPILYHRGPEYEVLLASVREGLKFLFQTKNEVLLFTSSGTGGMEGAVVNTLSPGDRALVIRGGKFGERWGEICEAYGLQPSYIDVEWGRAVEPDLVAAALTADPSIKAVFTTHSESSTGVLHDIEAIARIVGKTPAILIVDAITSVGVVDLPMDAWGVDVVVGGTQKALMIPPGLALCGVSDKAWAMVQRSRLPKFYFNFIAERKSLEKNQNTFTPAVSLVVALHESLAVIRAEGLTALFARHDRLARATRAGVMALGLQLFTERPTPALTTIIAPPGIEAGAIVKRLRAAHGITISGGQAQLKGKIFRLAHLGYADESDVVVCLAALERTLADLGYPVKLGEGIRAAQEVLVQAC